MNDRDRLEQLRALLARLERMPVSAERDEVLGAVRARAVDVETGEKPAAMRARSSDGAEPEPPVAPRSHIAAPTSRIVAPEPAPRPKPRRRSPSRRPAARIAWTGPRASPASPASCSSLLAPRQRAARDSVIDLLERGGVLCLDDQLAVTDGASRPWSAGLRG
jgi:hypothetical protein